MAEMKYDKGYNAMDYIGPLISKYKEDNRVFDKASNLIIIFQHRNDWPSSLSRLLKTVKSILKVDLFNVFKFAENYLEDDKITWPPDLPTSFKEELVIFKEIYSSFLYDCVRAEEEPTGLKGFQISEMTDNIKVLNIKRNDGQSLYLHLDKERMEQFIKHLNKYLDQKGDNDESSKG